MWHGSYEWSGPNSAVQDSLQNRLEVMRGLAESLSNQFGPQSDQKDHPHPIHEVRGGGAETHIPLGP